jgi:hypothetical protein
MNAIGIRDVSGNWQNSTARRGVCLLCACREILTVAIEHDDIGILTQQLFDDTQADTLRSPGDNNGLSR